MAPKKKASAKKGKSVRTKQKAKVKKPAKKKSKKLTRKSRRPSTVLPSEAALTIKGRGSRTAGQSGDTEGLSDVEDVDSESVEKLVEEGQDFEAELVDAVGKAPDPDEGELDAEVPEDDLNPDVRTFSKRNRL